MRIKVIFLVLFLVFLFGCATAVMHKVQYDIALEGVERPPEADEQYGSQKISPTAEKGYKYVFEDKMIKTLWFPSSAEIVFLLENKTNHSIEIMWNEAAYVCEKGESHKVMHAGVKAADREGPQRPSIVEGNGVIKDFIYPADYVYYTTDRWVERPLWGAGWTEKPLLPDSKSGGNEQEFIKKAETYIGKTLQVLLPIKVKDVTYDYVFTFKVKGVNLVTK